MNVFRPAGLALLVPWWAAACATSPPSTLESDLAILTLAAHHTTPVESPDGAVAADPSWLKIPEVRARFLDRGPAVIPALLQDAKERPEYTWAALDMISEIVRRVHAAPFTIPRRNPQCDYWVSVLEPGLGLSRIALRDIERERAQALEAFETWLTDNGYLKGGGAAYSVITGEHVFPLKDVALGAAPAEVEKRLGPPPVRLTEGFREPAIVRLEDLPRFDEQWGYPSERAATWVFFRNGKMVAAFEEQK